MVFSTPKRKSGLPSPAVGSSRKSKLQTPQSRRISRFATSFSSTKKSSSDVSVLRSSSKSSSVATPNPVLEAAKRSLDDESSSFLPEKKRNVNEPVVTSSASKPNPKRQTSGSVLESSTSSNSTKEEAVRVGVRIRPLLKNDGDPRAFELGPTENTIIRNVDNADNGSAYKFNHVYGESSSTQHLYDDMVSDIVDSVGRQGRNGTVFTYGQTSTGKTYTMHGILLAAGKDLFAMTQKDDSDQGSTSTSLTSVRISCMELYNEELRDLLCVSSTSLSIQEDRRGNVQIANLSERTVNNIDELMEVTQIAEENRTVGSTAMNEMSSRSHTIFRITYAKKEVSKVGGSYDELSTCHEEDDKENGIIRGGSKPESSSQRSTQKVVTTVSTLNLVDLAGSESVRVTGAKGERQKEGGKINQR